MSLTAATRIASRPDYNPIARFYRDHWCSHYHSGLRSMLDRLLLTRIPEGARILDICCGTGTVARWLVDHGYSVTGVDASEEMVRYAVRDVPEAEFVVADARAFQLPREFDAAICTFDSLSYMLDAADLERVFRNAYDALKPGGMLIFDLSLELAFKTEWDRSCSIVEDDEACFVRGSYDPAQRLGRTLITTFDRNGSWQRSDVEFVTRCYAPDEVLSALRSSGFLACTCHLSHQDDKLRVELGPGRACFTAAKP